MTIQLKNKYWDMVERWHVGYNNETLSISGCIKDVEGEDVYVSFGEVSLKEDVLSIQEILFDFIAASKLLEAKKSNASVAQLDEAIAFILSRWEETEFTSTLEHTETTPFVRIKNDYVHHFKFYYEPFSSYAARAFNAFPFILEALKREENNQIVEVPSISFDKGYFLEKYTHMLQGSMGSLAAYHQRELGYMHSRGIPFEDLEQMENEQKEEEGNMKKAVDVTLQVLQQLFYM